ncbi:MULTISPECIES: hypothetical protein [unclassified Microcoleus]|uniref:hypothetical protein n=1 Tax=unclassified Microcoleus TaxID=2642155 RepID=UPI002FD4DE93
MATAEPPRLTAQMSRKEAQQITDDIRSNFDSLGKMLIEVRERKGFLALGYQSLESYCLTEFGKGKARVYQLIEEARIEEGITAELAASDSPIKSLKMPGTYLRELKVLESPRQQIEAIAYANKLAQNEGKAKATKTHLQTAINKLNPQKTEQTKQLLKTIGFDKGVEVEVLEGHANGERGVIRKIDKKGVHVELYSGNSMPIVWDISELRIVPASERPNHPTMMGTINIGDKVRIFSSSHNRGKTGEIVARINDKLALVLVDNDKSEIPYAELEKIEVTEETQEQTTDLIWAGSWNALSSWYYNVKQHEIHSFLLPDLTFQPPAKASPSEWLEKWRQKNIAALADALLTEVDLVALVIASTSKMNSEDKEAFWAKVNVSKSHSEAVNLRIENDELRTQLAEASATLEEIVKAAKTSSPGDTAAHSDFLVENTPEISSPGDTAAHSDFLVENTPEISSSAQKPNNNAIIAERKKRIEKALEDSTQELLNAKGEKTLKKLKTNIRILEGQLEDVDKFLTFKVGDLIIKTKFPERKGVLQKLDLSSTGMPFAWVLWPNEYEEEPNSPEQHPLSVLTNFSHEDKEK